MTRHTIAAALFVGGLAGTVWASEPPTTPQFGGLPYPEQIILDLTKGQTSFRVEGSAFDSRPTDVVTISTVAFPAFMYLETTPGNPAYFAVGANDLTFDKVGFYDVFVRATDNEPIPVRVSTSFVVIVAPEPNVGLALFVSLSAALLRRRS